MKPIALALLLILPACGYCGGEDQRPCDVPMVRIGIPLN